MPLSYYSFPWEMHEYKKRPRRINTQRISNGYERGDKVKIRRNLKYPQRYGSVDFSASMKHYRGQIVTIIAEEAHPFVGEFYKIKEDNGRHSWSKEMFEKRYL